METQLTPRSMAARPGTGRTRTDLFLFAAVTLLVSWVPLAVTAGAGDAWFIVGTSGPTLAALLLWLTGRRRPPGPPWPVLTGAWRWVPAAVVLGVLPSLVAAVLTPAFGGPAFDPSLPGRLIGDVGGLAPALVMLLAAGPLAEEFGWRGYAQPRLRRFLGPVATSVVLGAAWAVWHLPLFFVAGTGQARLGLFTLGGALFLLTFVPMTYLFWFVTERLAGGVVSAVLLHAAFNGGLTFLGISSATGWAIVLGTVTVCALAAGTVRSRPRDGAAPGTPGSPAR